MLLVRSNRYETFVRTFFLKLCQKDNHLQSRETLKLLFIKINFTFSGSQQLLIFEDHETLSEHSSDQVIMKLRTLILTLCQNIFMHGISTNFETGLTRYNV